MYYTQNSLAVKRACSKDETRPALQNVLLDNGVALATDGHVLFRVGATKQYQEPDDCPKIGITPKNSRVLIYKDSADQLLKAIPKKSSLPVLHGFWTGTNGSKEIQAVATDLDCNTAVRTSEPEYPDIEKTWPEGEPYFEVAISGTILKQLAEFVKQARPENPNQNIKLTFRKEQGKAICFDAGTNDRGQKIDGLIMPLRIAE